MIPAQSCAKVLAKTLPLGAYDKMQP